MRVLEVVWCREGYLGDFLGTAECVFASVRLGTAACMHAFGDTHTRAHTDARIQTAVLRLGARRANLPSIPIEMPESTAVI